MAKKIGKLLFFGIAAGAAAAGVYHYLQKKDKEAEEFDDFDDLDAFDEDIKSDDKDRSYITLDTAKYLVNDTIDKAKDVISKTSKMIQEKIDEAKSTKADEDEDFDDDFDEMVENIKDAAPAESNAPVSGNEAAEVSEDSTEEFFDDDEA